uniref:Tyrosine specific protein phosphatases domain-containing protein n=1 Tax=Globodera rostochiensis TaxID=31243 RepID=A0A914HCV4_GLORO
MVRTSRKIPTDWTKYEPIGATIGGSRIFAFKTPLYPELQNRISKECRFTTLDLVQKLASFDRSLGLVINCNNTRRYFCKKDLEGLGIDYKEIACPGRGFLYRMDVVKLFLKSVDDFLEQNNDNDLLIGVNCSNGVNRSGYLICNYLISRLGWSSHDALNAFENARGYPIERGSYVQALHKADREHRSKMMPLELDKNDNG